MITHGTQLSTAKSDSKRMLHALEIGIILAMAFICASCFAQTLPTAPHQAKPAQVFSKQNIVNLTAIAGLENLDAYSAHWMIGHGNKEMFLPSGLDHSNLGMYAFSNAKILGQILLTYELNKHGHRKIAL